MTNTFSPELVAWYESLTSRDAEDWQIILAGKTVHGSAVHEDRTPGGKTLVTQALFELPLVEFKQIVQEYREDSRPSGRRRLGLITVLLCRDNLEKSFYLAEWLAKKGKAKTRNFNVISISGAAPVEESLDVLRNYKCTLPGWQSVDNEPMGSA